MLTKISLPEIGEIEFDSDLAPEGWVGFSYQNYWGSEPPYKGEAPDAENYYTVEIDGKEMLIFSQIHPGAICMFINEMFIDMDCVYDCENITWPYGGIPYGSMEWGCSSIDDMPSFCKDILNLFIDLGIVICVKGNPVGEYYAIPVCKDYYSSSDRKQIKASAHCRFPGFGIPQKAPEGSRNLCSYRIFHSNHRKQHKE